MLRGLRALLASEVVQYAPGRFLPALLAMVGTMIFTRIFTPAQYGILTLVNGPIGPIVIMAAQGGGQAAQRFYAEFRADGHAVLYDETLSLVWQRFVGLIGLASGVVVLLWGIYEIGHGPSRIPVLLLAGAAVSVTAQVAVSILTPVLPARRKIRAYSLFHVLNSVSALIFPLLLILLLGHHITWMVWGTALASLVMLPVILRLLHSDVRLRCVRHPSSQHREAFQRFIRYGVPMSIWLLGVSIMNSTDRYIIAWHFGPGPAALYSTNYNIAAQLYTLFSVPMLNAAWPNILQSWAMTRDPDLVRHQLHQRTQTYFLVGVGVIGGVAVAGNAAAHLLLGAAFYPGHVVLVPVMIGYVIWGAAIYGHKGLEIRERNDVMTLLCLIAAALNAVLNLILVPRFGWAAAAYATCIAYLAYAGLVWWRTRQFVPWDIPWKPLLRYGVVALAGILVVRGIPSSASFLATGLVRGLAFCVWYAGCLWVELRRRPLILQHDSKRV